MNKKSLIKNKKVFKQPKRILSGLKLTDASGIAKEAFNSSNIVGTIGNMTSGLGTVIESSLANAKVDTSKADNAIAAINAYEPNTSSLDAIASGYNAANTNVDINAEDMTISTGEGLANMGRAGLAGFTTGLQTGGIWGGIAGLFGGTAAAGITLANAALNAEDMEDLKRRELNIAKMSASKKVESARDAYHKNEYDNFMINHAAYGGPLYNHSGDWSNGLTFINEGGTHEENPFDGVLMGFDQEGIPNLVEEGEIIYNDYVFSNRLKPSKKQLESAGLNKKYNGWTFAKIVEDLQKTSAETPLDKISKESLDDMMAIMINMQEEVRMKKGLKGQNRLMANGGHKFGGNEDLFKFSITPFLPQYQKPLFYEDPIEKLKQRDRMLEIADNRSKVNTNVEVPSFIDFNEEEVVEDPLRELRAKVGKQPYDSKGKLLRINSMQNNGAGGVDPYFAVKSDMDKKVEDYFDDRMSLYSDDTSFDWRRLGQQVGQALPIISNTAKTLYNAATPIDYSNVIAEQAYRETPVMSLPRLGGKQVYRGIDRNRLINPIINTGRATARDIQNNALTAGQALANLANASYNTQRAIGEAYANADQQDLANRLQVAQFNLGIDQANANLSQAEQAANIERANRIAAARVQDAAMREQLQQLKGQAVDETSTATVQGISDLTRQNIEWDMIKNNPALAEAIAIMSKGYSSKYGGMLTKRKRRK